MLKHFNVFSLFKANYIKLNDVFMLKNNNYILMTGKKKRFHLTVLNYLIRKKTASWILIKGRVLFEFYVIVKYKIHVLFQYEIKSWTLEFSVLLKNENEFLINNFIEVSDMTRLISTYPNRKKNKLTNMKM